MRNFLGYVLVTAAITLTFCFNAIAAGGKIGYVDITGAMAQSQWGKKITDDLKKEEERLTSAVKDKNQAFVTARDEYIKKKDAMDSKAKDRREKELRDMAEELQKLASESQSKWNEQKNAAMAPLYKKVVEVANKIAKDDKYDYILDKNMVVASDGKDDITSKVVSELDKSSPK